MIDIEALRQQAAKADPTVVTLVDLAFLAQIADEIDAGRKAQAELDRLRKREGNCLGRRSLR